MTGKTTPVWEAAFEGADETYVPTPAEIRRKPSGSEDQGRQDEND
jgi:hypothetical protein